MKSVRETIFGPLVISSKDNGGGAIAFRISSLKSTTFYLAVIENPKKITRVYGPRIMVSRLSLGAVWLSGAHRTAHGRRPVQRGTGGDSGFELGGDLRRKWRSLAQFQIGESVDAFEDGGQAAPSFVDHEHKVVHEFRRMGHESREDP